MSNITDLFELAVRSLMRRKLRAYLTIIGIFIGIAAIVALVSLGQGLKVAIMDSFSGFGPDQLLVQARAAGFAPPGAVTGNPLTEKDVKVVEGVPGVDVIAKRTIRAVKVEFNKKATISFSVAIPDERAARDFVLTVYKAVPAIGRLVTSQDRGKVMIGSRFAEADNIFGKVIRPGDTLVLNGQRFDVVGVLEKSGRPGGDSIVFFTEKDFDEMFSPGDTIGIMAIKVAKGENVERVAQDITKALGKSRNQKVGKEDFTVQTPGQVLSTFNTIINIVQAVVVGIAAISLLVGGIGVMNTMYTAVLERTRDIGVMKAIGARNQDVFRTFLFESGLLGVTGGIIGILIGLGAAKLVEFGAMQALGRVVVRVEISLSLIIFALLFSFIVGSVSGTLPALQAARTNPVEALRK